MTTTFAALGVPDEIVRALERRQITAPFPIQVATIPDALAGRDLCGKAPTGSGKTVAFGVPMVARVKRAAPKRPKGLVLAPTRELALQVADELRVMSGDLRVLAVYGGAGLESQIKALRKGVDIVVACPGRLLDLIDRRACDLRDVAFAVIDEADRMADMGFLPDVRRILDQTNDVRQTVLFSATLDGAIDDLVKHYQHDPAVHEVADEATGDISHHFWLTERQDRLALLAQIVDRTGASIVFCRTKHGSDRVARQLANAGVKAAAIHGNRSQAQRERALSAFHRGDVAALVATDVAARGIHVEGVACVVHFDLPPDPKDYIHRSGRTGRAGADGAVVSLFDKAQRKDAVKLKKGAGVGDVEIAEPHVDVLPEGAQRRFRPEPRRGRGGEGGRDERGHGERGHGERGQAGDDRGPTTGGGRRTGDGRGGAQRRERGAGTQTPRVTARPAPERDRTNAPSGQNRAERRSDQFTPAERAARAAANERPQRRGGQGRTQGGNHDGARRGGAGAGELEAAPAHRLPAATPGGDKVRPSGASRRKARREALRSAGEDGPGPTEGHRRGPIAPGGGRRGGR